MCPVEISILVKAGSSLQDEVLDRDDGGRSFSFDNDIILPLEAASDVVPLPAIRARQSSFSKGNNISQFGIRSKERDFK